MSVSRSIITGPLQVKIMMALRSKQMTGTELMEKLGINSPGTIYPALETLRERGLIEQRTERTGSVRRKIASITETGAAELRNHLMSSARLFCCDVSLHMKRIIEVVRELVKIRPGQRILSTFEHEEVKRAYRQSNVTYSYNLDELSDTYDIVLSFLGVGCLIGKEVQEIWNYAHRLYRVLKEDGTLLIVEIEKTENVFAEVLFNDVFGLDESPGISTEELEEILTEVGLKDIHVTSKAGILYAVSKKP
ncbi:MAG: helix-turn-helix transcriptional regulator [Candidatus Thorarchaeota archaeon]